MKRVAKIAGAGPLADFEVGQRVMTAEGFPGVIDDIHEGPADLTTYFVTLDNNMGGGEYAEAEIQPVVGQSTAQRIDASVEHTAADDYPELGSILSDRLPPQINARVAAKTAHLPFSELQCPRCGTKPEAWEIDWDNDDDVLCRGCGVHYDFYGHIDDGGIYPRHTSVTATNDEARDWGSTDREDMEPGETFEDPPYAEDVASRLALYLPIDGTAKEPSRTDIPEEQKAGYREGFTHGQEGITRKPSQPEDEDFRVGYDLGWAEGVTVQREPANSWDLDDLTDQQRADTPPATVPSAFGPTTAGLQTEAGATWDWIKDNSQPGSEYSYDWCRFRRQSHCWLPKGLNVEASREAGYAVWIPEDRGSCYRFKWESQQRCPTGMPGPNSGAGGFTDATVPWEQGGQRGGVPGSEDADPAKYSAKTAAQTACPICGDVMLSQTLGMSCMACGTIIPFSATENLHVISDDGLLEMMRAKFAVAAPEGHEFIPNPDTGGIMCAECGHWRYSHPGEKPLQQVAAGPLGPHEFEPTPPANQICRVCDVWRWDTRMHPAEDPALRAQQWNSGGDEGLQATATFEHVMYHYAPVAARDSIARHGLDWTKGANAHQPIIGFDEDDNEIELPKANYLYFDIQSVREALPSGHEIYEVDVAGLPLDADPYEDSEAALTTVPISSSRVRLLQTTAGRTAAFEFTASWKDIREKAKRIRSEGGVRMVASQDGTIVGHVKGDTGVYETEIVSYPGKRNAASWACGCKWSSYSWGRSGPWKKFEGRMCSHALALQYEAQSRGMFGKEITLDEKQPSWMDAKHVKRPGDYDRDKQRYTHLTTPDRAEEEWDTVHLASPLDDALKSRLRSASTLEQAAEIMLTLARREEPKVVSDITTLAAQNHGELIGLQHRFKSSGSLLRKMKAEASLFRNPGEVAMNMSDTLRFTVLFSPEHYTEDTEDMLDGLRSRGYKARVKNYWQRGDAYNGVNVALTTPTGHPVELQFHTEASFLTKEQDVHPIYEQWRVEPNPNVKAILGHKMRDLFDMVPRPGGALGIADLKRQPMVPYGQIDWFPARAAALASAGGYRYLALHHIDDDPETPEVAYAVLRATDAVVEVWRDGGWVEDSEFGRYVFLGEPSSEEVTEDEAMSLIEGMADIHRPVMAQNDDEVPSTVVATQMLAEGQPYTAVREMLLSAGVVEPAKVVASIRTTAFKARVNGEFRDIDINDDGFHDETGAPVDPATITFPKWHPTMGLDPNEEKVLTTGSRDPFVREGALDDSWKKSPLGNYYRISVPTSSGEVVYITTRGYYDSIEAFTERPSSVSSGKVRIGGMSVWTSLSGKREPLDLFVKEEYRRQGIASAMFDLAKVGYPDLTHADALTDDGKGFASGHPASKRTAQRRLTLYRGEGSHDTASYYPKTGPDAWLAGAWWTDDPAKASGYAASAKGQVYVIEVDESEVQPMGAPGNYVIADPEVRKRRRPYTGEHTAAARTPAVLYHYTSGIHLPEILSSGHLRLTESNIEISGAGPGVVWLTTTIDPGGNGLDGGYDKGSVRLTIDASGLPVHHWPTWAFEQGIEGYWYDALDKAGGNGSENWWVCTQPIPLDRVLTIEVNGVPYDFKQGSLRTEASLFDGYSDEDVREHLARFPDAKLHVFQRDPGFMALWQGMPVGQITYTIEQDERVFSEDDDEIEAAKGDLNGYYAKIDVLVVHREARHRGVGTALLKAFVEWATKTYGYGTDPKDQQGFDPGGFTAAGAGLWKAVMGETVPVTQRTNYASLHREAMPVAPLPAGVRWAHGRLRSMPGVPQQQMLKCKSAEGKQIGFIRWLDKDYKRPPGKAGEIVYVFVDPEYRRRGVATEMLAKARSIDPRVHHSETLTEDGQAWSQVAASLRVTADEDQCPFDGSDSLVRGGLYICEEGHSWHPDEPAAKAFHGGAGELQPVESSQFGQFAEIPALMTQAAAEQQVEVSGVVLKAADTGRILLLQRALTEDDEHGGKWEWPGGHHEAGDLTSLHAAVREWEEEVGQRFPEGGTVTHTWTSPDGVYQGHLVVIPTEDAVPLHEARVVDNPDNDGFEQAAWWDPADAEKNPVVRKDCQTTAPWSEIKRKPTKEGAKMDTADEFGSLFDYVESPSGTPVRVAAQQPVTAATDWGLEPSYNFNDELLWAGPNAPHPGLGHTMTPGFDNEPVEIPDETIDDDPDAALPVTYGDEDDGAGEDPARVAARLQQALAGSQRAAAAPSSPRETEEQRGRRLLAYADAVARGEQPEGPNPFAHLAAGQGDNEMAQAAARYLTSKQALKTYSPVEQKQIIDEGMDVRASNLDRLDITGTHYEALDASRPAAEDEDLTFLDGDPNLGDF